MSRLAWYGSILLTTEFKYIPLSEIIQIRIKLLMKSIFHIGNPSMIVLEMTLAWQQAITMAEHHPFLWRIYTSPCPSGNKCHFVCLLLRPYCQLWLILIGLIYSYIAIVLDQKETCVSHDALLFSKVINKSPAIILCLISVFILSSCMNAIFYHKW